MTPTPTIVPDLKSPIILLPGLGASWNPLDIYSCNLNSSGNWTLAPYIHTFNRLINTFTKNANLKMNEDFYVYGYDWRQPLDKQGDNLKKFIDNILVGKTPGTRVTLLGHSLGGMVIRSYLTNYPSARTVSRVLTIGSPHQGTVMAYPIWENGDIRIDDKFQKIAVSQIIEHCRKILSPSLGLNPDKKLSKREVVQRLVPVFKQILPVFDYLKRNNIIVDTDTLSQQNDWLKMHPEFPALADISVKTLSGTGVETVRYLKVKDPNASDIKSGDWVDGKVTGKENVRQGDGTILNFSSQLPEADNTLIRGNHEDIVSKKENIRKILDLLGLSAIEPFAEQAIPEENSTKVLTISTTQPSEIRLSSKDPKTDESGENILALYDPENGEYEMKIKPRENGKGYLYVQQYDEADEDRMIEKEITFTKNKSRSFLLKYSAKSDPKLILLDE